ncbi:MAG TPA: Dabb family protein [Solirubrobacteraceae bacterium]|nr:Dabb family protein [Solirubrobacteraceae bacterium]
MIRHVVLFKWKAESTAEQRAAAIAELRTLPDQIEAVRSFVVGENVGDPDNHELAVIAEFDDIESFRAYSDHPAHLDVAIKTIGPILEQRARIQTEL